MNIGLSFHLGEYLVLGRLCCMAKYTAKFIKAVKLFLEWQYHFAFAPAMYKNFSVLGICISIWYCQLCVCI